MQASVDALLEEGAISEEVREAVMKNYVVSS